MSAMATFQCTQCRIKFQLAQSLENKVEKAYIHHHTDQNSVCIIGGMRSTR